MGNFLDAPYGTRQATYDIKTLPGGPSSGRRRCAQHPRGIADESHLFVRCDQWRWWTAMLGLPDGVTTCLFDLDGVLH